MFSRLVTIILFVLPIIIAAPTYDTYGPYGSPESCASSGTGSVMCCNDATNDDPSGNQGILGTLLSLGLAGINIPVDVNCNPITVDKGASSQSCTGQVACCTDNEVNTLVSLECIPINVSA